MEDLCLEATTRRLYGTLVLHCINDNFAIYDLSNNQSPGGLATTIINLATSSLYITTSHGYRFEKVRALCCLNLLLLIVAGCSVGGCIYLLLLP